MFKKVKIGTKLTILVLVIIMAFTFIVSFAGLEQTASAIEQRYLQSLNAIADVKTQKISQFVKELKVGIRLTQNLSPVKDKFKEEGAALGDIDFDLGIDNDSTNSVPKDTTDSSSDLSNLISTNQNDDELDKNLKSFVNAYQLNNIYLVNNEGSIIYIANRIEGKDGAPESSSSGQILGASLIDKDGKVLTAARDSIYLSTPFLAAKENVILAASSVIDDNNNFVGTLIYEVNLNTINQLVKDTTGLGKSAEIVLAKVYSNKLKYLTALNNSKKTILADIEAVSEEGKERALQEAVKGKKGSGRVKDIDERNLLAAWRYIPDLNAGLVVRINADEITAPIQKLKKRFIYVGIGVLVLALIVSIIFSRFLTNPLLNLKDIVISLGKGELPPALPKLSNDEIGEMTLGINNLVENLNKTADFARSIGEGDFKAEFNPLSNRDTLGNALLSMRDSIQASATRDDEQNWIVTGVAEIGDILRSTTDLKELADAIIAYVVKKINAIQGAFYVVNGEEQEDAVIEMIASYAYNKKKYLNASFRFAEGLVGQSAIEQDTVFRTEIPDDYMSITSGLLGDKKPKCLLITPLITNDTEVYGVIELAGFQKFATREINFVKEISDIIARTIFNIKVTENTKRLLEEAQELNTRLQAQQNELRRNEDIIKANQRELERTNQELEVQIEEVEKAQRRMQILLENASEVITIYEPDGLIRYISPSVEKILGYTQEEMIGIKDIMYVHPKGAESINMMFSQLLEDPDEKIRIQFSYKTKSGESIWLEATGTNLLNDPIIQGIVVNTRDITERRRAEKEERMRGQMQALSENSPDLITRFNKEKTIFYINPTIETYTGRKTDAYLMKPLQDVVLSEELVNRWASIIEEVITTNEKINAEVHFPSPIGERVMQVNAIPEYNEQNAIESVLIVSHDITERKLIELEIQSKNKKITESINYAKRIQEAILPDTQIIQNVFPKSFILYKPRDVVSGDFPWFLQRGDDIYIAVVDCTGHGVPGALISLIGYFLLNNIIEGHDDLNPGAILDLLNEAVTRTLRQDASDSSTRDGMDIALCKINLQKQELEYAGAHRPLYFFRNGELTQINGNKFPIGGAQYRNRDTFTNTKIDLQPDDTVFFFSDGFPDQFRGPDNKKYSPKRIRDVINLTLNLEMSQIHEKIDQDFEAWKGDYKQTDDVLMIGIRF